MNLEIIIRSEVSQEEKDKHHIEPKIRYKSTNLWNRNIFLNIENKLMFAKMGGSGGRKEWEFGISRGKLLYVELTNKILLYSMGYSTVTNIMEKNMKEKTYIYN